MKVRALWGFVGDADLLKADSAKVKRGEVFDHVNDEYAHVLIGKGLAVEVGGSAPKENKQVSATEKKAAAEKAAAEKAAAEKAQAEKAQAEKDAAEKAAAEKEAAEKAAKEAS
ncbi:hypothetical protein ACDH60_10230 [Pseudomonas ficuserectae]|uniref:Uncharacterized protein n=2 Tax=Pseudomonas amygdali pv. lachrymans TaxID=53707 RepID=A0AB37R2R6_PSEAV|nr:hypothetical protein [Pseudomonas amygdali]ARA79625.1 hypothetical protein B5U27_05835 [Pseudomonas amygdali pv. lachrymans]AXH54888.1 hypothetical protein PLA107_005735 [Pseudomonas amygdali pv. lachrymans str. M301315]KKY57456.1 hypothetical protein AAY85_13135 [Pseudomonas amygdali pv. lachrymans]KPC01792.1 Uncharacterized protein AC501_3075 [Pseudomonas amygdali pv. lachrymans]KPC19935.1 Uncharacterized protein AC499_2403 [Pseudomonas amygdali pv. lachrymans]